MNGFSAKEQVALKPGDCVRWGVSNGDYVSKWIDGVVLAIGRMTDWGSSRIVDGAIVAWHDRYPEEGYSPDYVSFVPFWNQRFQPVR